MSVKSAPDTSSRAIFHQAWPIFVAQLTIVLNSAIDTVMAGRLSATDLAGVALGGAIYVSIYIALLGVVSAVGPIVGHHYGAGRLHQIGDDLGQALWLAAALALLGMAVLLWRDPWFALARAPAAVTAIAGSYLTAVALGLPAALGTRVFVALNSAVSRPKVTMAIHLVALVLKVPLNALFMFGAGPLPALGGAGCGVATALLACLTFALSLAIWRLDPFFARFRTQRAPRLRLPAWQSQKELIKLGIPIGFAVLIEVWSFTFMGILIARLGVAALGGHQIVANVVSTLFMVPLSLGFASGALIAQSLGAGHPRAARRAALRGVRMALAAAIAAASLLWLGRNALLTLYTDDASVAAVALALIAWATWFHIGDALQCIAFHALRAYKVAAAPMLIYGISLWGVGIGGGYWLAYSATPLGPPMGAAGFWIAALVGFALAAIALLWLLLWVSKQHIDDGRKKGPDDVRPVP